MNWRNESNFSIRLFHALINLSFKHKIKEVVEGAAHQFANALEK